MNKKFSNAQPISHLIILSLITFSIYEIYWFYRNWKHLKEHKDLKISPFWRTVGMFVPILGIFLVYNHFRDIRDFAKASGVATYSSPGWLTAGYLFLSSISFKLTLRTWDWTDPTSVLGITLVTLFVDLSALWFLAIVQKTLNSYWAKEQSTLEIKNKFSGREIVVLVIGGIVWILTLVGTFFPEG